MFYTHYVHFGGHVNVVAVTTAGKTVYQRLSPIVELHVEADEKGGPGVYKGWRDIHGNQLSTFRLDTARAKELVTVAEHQGIPVHGRLHPAAQTIDRAFGPDVFKPNFNLVNICYLDIETSMTHDEVRTIQWRMGGVTKIWGLKDYTGSANIIYERCDSERDMLGRFVVHWWKNYPHIVAHINGNAFDILILVERIEKLIGKVAVRKLSPWGWVKNAYLESNTGRKVKSYDLTGVVSIDWAVAYRKFIDQYAKENKLESFSLESIAQKVLGRGKVKFDGDLDELYHDDFNTFIDYGAEDAKLIEDMEASKHLIQMLFEMAMDSKSNISDCMGTVKMWDNIIANHLARTKIAVPNQVDDAGADIEMEKFAGGYVLEPLVGRHEWVCSFDFEQLYPSIIETFNISPETKVGMGEPIPGFIYSALGVNFLPRSEKIGFLPQLIATAKEARRDYRKRMETEEDEGVVVFLDVGQNKEKIKANSLYGSLGNPFSRYYDLELCESITLTGQQCIKAVVDALTALGLTVVAGDTDSCFIALAPYMAARGIEATLENAQAICDSIINPAIQAAIDEYVESCGVNSNNTIRMVAEMVAKVAIWAGKKNYILSKVSEKGKEKSETVIKGLRMKKKNTPKIHRDAILNMVEQFIIEKDDPEALAAHVEEHKRMCRTLHPLELAQATTLQKPPLLYVDGETWKKRTPQQYKAAIAHNQYGKSSGGASFVPIVERDTVYLFHLTGEHGFAAPVVANVHLLWPEGRLREAFDYDAVLDKNFMEPLRQVVTAIGREI